MKDTLDQTILEVEQEWGRKPYLVATSARPMEGKVRTSFATLRQMLQTSSHPFMLLLGTGWGLAEPILSQSDSILEPIAGGMSYNHLSVRSAATIMLHELLGSR